MTSAAAPAGPSAPINPAENGGSAGEVATPSSSLLPESSSTACHSSLPPTCSVVSSHAGKGLPERKTAATAASSGELDLR